ncbi:hypothetical protein PPACK8108_LOCUS11875 [Phakopsora pachyrhizi]|uniref:Uncharacterized protein n=1 Tax=Phakopsora pachyrhizi TaxID=170000 RepID=A0AAV0B2V5_PHAPC|nr:hypothetical protein PPACK8108_LOCUS11875 [Phakopsora pachyrhizi]
MLEFRMLFSINAITGSSMNKLWQGEITLDSAATEITSSNIGLLVNCTALEKLIPIYSATDTDSGHALVVGSLQTVDIKGSLASINCVYFSPNFKGMLISESSII